MSSYLLLIFFASFPSDVVVVVVVVHGNSLFVSGIGFETTARPYTTLLLFVLSSATPSLHF